MGPITEEWLKQAGFKWHQFDRQPEKHWLLWMGGALRQRPTLTDFEDLGIELAPCGGSMYAGEWFCWFRSDTAGRYHRFIHLRHLTTTDEVVRLVEAITGRPWTPENHFYGSVHSPERAERIRQDLKRIDMQMRLEAPDYLKHAEIEKDDTRGRALPEHMQAHAQIHQRDSKP